MGKKNYGTELFHLHLENSFLAEIVLKQKSITMNNFWFARAVIVRILLVSACSYIWYKTKPLLSDDSFIFADVLISFEAWFIGAACRAQWNSWWNLKLDETNLKAGSSSQEHLLRFLSLGWICSQSVLTYCALKEPQEMYWFHMVSAFSYFTLLVSSVKVGCCLV